jgi:hypothetical protein
MTSTEFPLAKTNTVNLQQAAMDLARRLSSLRDFIPAAHELVMCDSLPAIDIQRHCRKVRKHTANSLFTIAEQFAALQIVTLIEVSFHLSSRFVRDIIQLDNCHRLLAQRSLGVA